MNKKELLEKLELSDAFEDFSAVPGTRLWGWNGDRSIFPGLVSHLRPKLIIEVGSWMGLSAANLANSCAALDLDTAVICIDTWLGSKEHWRDPELKGHLEMEYGRPTFYKRFLSNMIQAGCADKIVPLSMPSQIGASYLKDFKLQADLIYIDGSHDEKDVYDDLLAYWDLLSPGGAIFGDDWPWDSVANAVKAFCAEVGVPYQVNDINWIIRKSADPE
jgi:predicted O-methyltransferase YrrM